MCTEWLTAWAKVFSIFFLLFFLCFFLFFLLNGGIQLCFIYSFHGPVFRQQFCLHFLLWIQNHSLQTSFFIAWKRHSCPKICTQFVMSYEKVFSLTLYVFQFTVSVCYHSFFLFFFFFSFMLACQDFFNFNFIFMHQKIVNKQKNTSRIVENRKFWFVKV